MSAASGRWGVRRASTRWLVTAAVLAAIAVASIVLVRRPGRDGELLTTLDREYRNGGLFQFFWNTRGRQNAATLDALTRARRPEHARLFGRAVQIFDAERPGLEDAWTAFDASRDVGLFAAAKARSGIASLDAAWLALPPLST